MTLLRDDRSSIWWILARVMLLVAVVSTVSDGLQPVKQDDPRIYVETAESITEGRYESVSEASGLPRYPPGFPLMLAPFVAIAGDDGAGALSLALGAVLASLVWLCGLRVAGNRGATLSALLWIASPLVSDYATDVMSDPAAAVMVLLAALAVMAERWMLAGLALGWSCWIRLVHVAFLVGFGRRARAWIAAGLLVVPLALFQLHVYGRLAGYDHGQAQFSVDFIFERRWLLYMGSPSQWPNWQFVPGMLAGLRGGVVPLLFLFTAYDLWVRREEPVARFAALVILANVVVYLPYFFQASRFMVPGACFVIVFGASGIVRVVDGLVAARSAPTELAKA